MIHVQFEDEAKVKIVAVFGSAQDPEHYENLDIVGDDDSRYSDFYVNFPESMRKSLVEPTPTD